MRHDRCEWMAVLFISLLAVSGCDRSPSGTAPSGPASATPAAKAPGDQIDADVVRIVSEQMGVRASELHPQIHLTRDLKADELDQVELVMELEDHFEISIPDEDAEKLQTLAQVSDYVRARKKR
jgi:acyl carrier protein